MPVVATMQAFSKCCCKQTFRVAEVNFTQVLKTCQNLNQYASKMYDFYCAAKQK